MPTETPEQVVGPSVIAELAGVSARTVTRWADAGKLTVTRTLGGQRRFRLAEARRELGIDRPDPGVVMFYSAEPDVFAPAEVAGAPGGLPDPAAGEKIGRPPVLLDGQVAS